MYSHEIENYLKEHNYRLDTSQIQYLMDTRLNPQVKEISFNDWTSEYTFKTSDGWELKFTSIPYTEYIQSVRNIISMEEHRMNGDHFRLYASLEAKPYEHIVTSRNIQDLFIPMDIFILNKEVIHSKYLVIWNHNNGDEPIYLGYGDKVDYLKFKERWKLKQDEVPKMLNKSIKPKK